jgi:hypothetical protein
LDTGTNSQFSRKSLRSLARKIKRENRFAAKLGRLESVWCVRDLVPAGAPGGQFDLLVISPSGVYVVASKLLLSQINSELLLIGMKRASEALSAACGFGVHVHPVIVPEGRKPKMAFHHDDIVVICERQFLALLRSKTCLVPADQARDILRAGRSRSTWTTNGSNSAAPITELSCAGPVESTRKSKRTKMRMRGVTTARVK